MIGFLYLLAKGLYALWVKLMLNKDSYLNVFPKPEYDVNQASSLKKFNFNIPANSAVEERAQEDYDELILEFKQEQGTLNCIRSTNLIGKLLKPKYFEVDVKANSNQSQIFIGYVKAPLFQANTIPSPDQQGIVFNGSNGSLQVKQQVWPNAFPSLIEFGDCVGIGLLRDVTNDDDKDICHVIVSRDGEIITLR